MTTTTADPARRALRWGVAHDAAASCMRISYTASDLWYTDATIWRWYASQLKDLKDLYETSSVEYTINGEEFIVEVEAHQIVIRHPHWSLIGFGATLGAAKQDLLSEARELRDTFSPNQRLSAQAARLHSFISQLA